MCAIEEFCSCPAGVDVAQIARVGDDLEHRMHGDGSFDKEAGVYTLYARCRHASPVHLESAADASMGFHEGADA